MEQTRVRTVFHLMRHAPTAWNEARRIQGQTDIPLSDAGREVARAWRLPFPASTLTALVTSDLSRTRDTAAIITADAALPTIRDPRLREQNWGDWVGLTISQIRSRDSAALQAQERAGWNFRPPGGESRREVLTRAAAALKDAAATHPGGELLVVAHLGVVKCLVYSLLKHSFLPEDGDPVHKHALHTLVWASGALNLRQHNREL